MSFAHRIALIDCTPESFAPFGSVLVATEDGAPPSEAEQLLDLSAGVPRFYLMNLRDKPPIFRGLTRHRLVTQGLASVGGHEWMLAVAAPQADPAARPEPADVVGFRIPGDVSVLLRRGTWHAGPFFSHEQLSFFNLELADTNVVDHQTHLLANDSADVFELVDESE